jgi:hypothetical protein
MASIKTIQRSFVGGEIAPELFGRIDLDKYQSGLAECLNFVVLPHGPAQNRAGFSYILQTKYQDKKSNLIEFAFSTEQTYVLEFGDGYIRVHTNGGTLLKTGQNITAISQAAEGVLTYSGADPANGTWFYLSGIVGMTELNGRYVVVSDVNAGANTFKLKDLRGNYIDTSGFTAYVSDGTIAEVYEIASPYAEADLFDIHYVQSADVLTLVHPTYAPRELRRTTSTTFTLSQISFLPTINGPTGVDVAATVGTGSVVYRYQVTSIADESLEESLVSPESVDTARTITAITKAAAGVFTTSANHLLSVEDEIYISGVGGMVEITDGTYYINTVPAANTFTVKNSNGVVVNTTSYTTFTSGGSVLQIAVGITNNLATAGNKNTVSWTMVSGAIRYNVYKEKNGLYGYIGQATGTSFVDDNILSDVTRTPPEAQNLFDGADNYPGAVSYFEQRRCFGGTNNKPQNFWMTRSGTESNLNYSIPTQDDDAIALRIVSREVQRVRNIVPLTELLILTSGGEWKISTQNSDALTPSSVTVRPQSYNGCTNVQPVVVNNTGVYVRAQSGRLHDLAYNFEANGFKSNDLSLIAPHLFDGYNVVDMCLTRTPVPIVWVIRSDGKLLGITYMPEQKVFAWHQHETDGLFESVAAVNESGRDVLYVTVQRSVNGQTVRYIERLSDRLVNNLFDSFIVDSGLTYNGVSATTINGLHHLEGKIVVALANGAVVKNLTVTNGAITLPQAATLVHVGLPITSRIKTLPVSFEGPALGQGMVKSVNRTAIRVYRTSGLMVGYDVNNLVQFKQRTSEPYGSAPEWITDELDITIKPDWNTSGQVVIQQTDPLPVTVLSMVMEVALGG